LELLEADKALTAFETAGQYNKLPFGVTNGVPAFQRTMDANIDSEKPTGTFPYLNNVTVGGGHKLNMTQMFNACLMR